MSHYRRLKWYLRIALEPGLEPSCVVLWAEHCTGTSSRKCGGCPGGGWDEAKLPFGKEE